MIKIYHNNNLLFLSLIVSEVAEFILQNDLRDIIIIKEFEHLTYDDFCRLYLHEEKDFETYSKLECKLNPFYVCLFTKISLKFSMN